MNDNLQLEVGMVVTPRGSGPRMTINRFKASGDAVCIWFEGSEMKIGDFAVARLARADTVNV